MGTDPIPNLPLATAVEILVEHLTSWWGLTTEEAFEFIQHVVEDEHASH